MRAPGESVGTFGLECAVDELAVKLGMDPIDLRIRNEPEKDPTTGLPFSARHIAEAWRAGAERFGWETRSADPGVRRDGDWRVGMGCATATYPYYRMPGGAARIKLRRDGHATVSISAHEMGMGTATVQTQIAAERLGLSMEQVTFAYGDNILPGTVLVGGSQQTAAVQVSLFGDISTRRLPDASPRSQKKLGRPIYFRCLVIRISIPAVARRLAKSSCGLILVRFPSSRVV
jgi:xanthine dehydrogenase YagR molybdenum-binding subunit